MLAMTPTMPGEAMTYLTQSDVLNAHTQHGLLDWRMVKAAMGPNWPAEWEQQGPGEGIWAPEEDRRP
jgi:hypothetical protein